MIIKTWKKIVVTMVMHYIWWKLIGIFWLIIWRYTYRYGSFGYNSLFLKNPGQWMFNSWWHHWGINSRVVSFFASFDIWKDLNKFRIINILLALLWHVISQLLKAFICGLEIVFFPKNFINLLPCHHCRSNFVWLCFTFTYALLWNWQNTAGFCCCM